MRLKLIFEIKKNELPRNNKNLWLAFIKYSLSQLDPQYKRAFFDPQKKEKDYSFCVLFPHPSFRTKKEKVILNSYQPVNKPQKVTLLFSAYDGQGTGTIFKSAFEFVVGKPFFFPNQNEIMLKHIIEMEENMDMLLNEATFISPRGSGILIREHNRETNYDKFYTIQDADFNKFATSVIKRQVAAAGFDAAMVNQIHIRKADEYEDNRVWPSVHYRTPCKVSNAIHITAPKEILIYLYQAGIGSKHSMGYGYIEKIIV